MGRGFSLVAQPITILLISKYFTPAEQGYYYTFANILSISILLELGLGVILMQFASHEYAYLSWSDGGTLTGNPESLSRLLSIMRKGLKWYGFLSVALLIILIPVGLYFFGSNSESGKVNYALPWLFLVVFSTLNLFLYPVVNIIEGCGKVVELQKMRLYQALLGALSIWLVIVSKGNLLAASMVAVSNFAVSIAWIYMNFKGLIRQVLMTTGSSLLTQVAWRREVLPMQWRIALSSISGYMLSQLFNPLLFRYQSPAVAGQMGMSLSISSVALTFSVAWISTKFPMYGVLIQKRQFNELDAISLKSTIQALIICIAMSVALLCIIFFIKRYFVIIGDRLLSLPAIAAILFSNITTLLVISMAGYLRAHRVEPLLIMSLTSGISTAICSVIAAKYFTAEIMTYSVACINLLIALPFTSYILVKKRREWHAAPFKTSA